MLAKNDIIKDAASTKNIADRVRFGRHILDVYNLRSYIAWSSASDKQIVRVISDCGKTKVNDYRFFAENDVIRFEISMNNVSSGHFCQAS